MFYDESVNARRPANFFRIALTAVSIVLIPPFMMLAIVPMLLLLLPVAFVALPFMMPAFVGGTHANQMESKRIRSWHPALAVAVTS